MIPVDQITHRFLIVGVAAAACVPRQPSDHPNHCTVGGRLSASFRKLLLCIVGLNLVRMITLWSPTDDNNPLTTFGDILGVVEVTGLTFLCFLTAYVLQKGLAEFFHINPGQNLKVYLYLAALLSFLGVTLSRSLHPNLWALKKLGNAVSAPVIIQTLRSYNRFTTQASHGRGFIIGQTLMVIEYWHFAVQLACALAYAVKSETTTRSDESEMTLGESLMEAARSSAFLADWTRVLAHAIFLNQMDEMYHTTSFTSSSTSFSGEDEAGTTTPSSEIIPLAQRPRKA